MSYLTKFSKVKEELVGVGEIVPDRDLVNFSLLGFTKLWQAVIDGICAQENFLDCECLWGDCIQE